MKVRDIYDGGDYLVLVTTDRQSAFDRILASIPFKGQVISFTRHITNCNPCHSHYEPLKIAYPPVEKEHILQLSPWKSILDLNHPTF